MVSPDPPVDKVWPYPIWAFKPCGAEACFDGHRSYDPDGSITYWRWTFGDQSKPEMCNVRPPACVAHRYDQVGSYSAQLTVWDDEGNSSSDYTVVYVADFGISVADSLVRVGDVTKVTIWSDMPQGGCGRLSFNPNIYPTWECYHNEAKKKDLKEFSWPVGGGHFQTSFYAAPRTYYCGPLWVELCINQDQGGYAGIVQSSDVNCVYVAVTMPADTDRDGKIDDPENEFTFSGSGILKINCLGGCNTCKGPGNRVWVVNPIGEIEGVWTPCVPGDVHFGTGPCPSVSFYGLPMSNSAFGIKVVLMSCRLSLTEWYSAYQRIEVFFDKYATNHPGEGHGITPNWYYYWSQTGASRGTHRYDGTRPGFYGYYLAGDTHFYICPLACGLNDLTGHDGIDTFAEICLHENKHKMNYEAWWVPLGGYNPLFDLDRDDVLDSAEPALGLDPAKRDTDGDG